MKMKLIYTVLIFSNLVFFDVLFAQELCEDLFYSKVQKQFLTKDVSRGSNKNNSENDLIQKIATKLADTQSNYFIEENKLFINLNSGLKKEIAVIKVIYPKYVFEYQTKSYHEHWLNNGVTSADMNLIINSRGQVYGRGYYVSLSPTDSQQFGTYLTTFRINKPLVLLQFRTIDISLTSAIKENPTVIKLLKWSGISGILCNNTWVSIFDESHLKHAAALDSSSLSYALNLNLDESLRRDILNENNNNLTRVSQFKYVKNARVANFKDEALLKHTLSELTDVQKMILIDRMSRNGYDFAQLVLKSSYKNNALDLYSNLLIFLKRKNYKMFRQVLLDTKSKIVLCGLGFEYKELINRVGLNE